MRGFVYILSNPAMPGIYKIGYTTRRPEERAEELNTTGVPRPFSVEYAIIIDNCEIIEAETHRKLANFRYGKEFFRCDLNHCIISLKEVAHSHSSYAEKYSSKRLRSQIEGWEEKFLLEKKKEEAKRRVQKQQEERERAEHERKLKQYMAEQERLRKKKEEKERRINKACFIIFSTLIPAMILSIKSKDWLVIWFIFSACLLVVAISDNS